MVPAFGQLPEAWHGRRILLHFQAVDHDATVWVDGVEVARHRGRFTPFTADLSDVTRPGEVAVIVVRARDSRHAIQARGKQATEFANSACYYTRTTGIWQSVWLEAVPPIHLRRPRITPDVAGSAFHLEMPLSANRPGWTVRASCPIPPGRSAPTPHAPTWTCALGCCSGFPRTAYGSGSQGIRTSTGCVWS